MTDLFFVSLLGTQHVDRAAIFNAEGTSVWATSPSFNVTPAELKEIVGAYADTSVPKKVQSTGLHIAGQKYIVIKADETSLYGKKVGYPTHFGDEDGDEEEQQKYCGMVCEMKRC